MEQLIKKYNQATPRYTSYPTLPHWDAATFTPKKYLEAIKNSSAKELQETGIALYIHLPYCESLCTYCGCNTRITVNHAVELPYVEAVLKEWNLYLGQFSVLPKIKEIHLGGGTPTFFSAEHLSLLIKGILKNISLTSNPKFSFEGHPANTTVHHLETLYKLGFKRLSLGIQDYNEKVQIAINRKQSVEQVEQIVTQAREIGYESINFDIVYGLPFQTKDSTLYTLTEVLKQKPERIAYYSYAHVPWKRPGQRAYSEKDLPEGKDKLELFLLGRKILLEAGYESIGMDHFALPNDALATANKQGTLHRNFMGYTDQSTAILVGLGVSAISDISYAYGQNVKTVEEYISLVDKGEIPVFKGHFLNKQDRLVKQHILNLLCKHKTDWKKNSEEDAYFTNLKENLSGLEQDKIVETTHNSISITPLGQTFSRNVCAAVDYYLMAETKENKFSMAI
ncbi:MAG: oxygen-independent coproporphyrinogen III oxidase [Luteibaculaceae bacterium]